MESLKEPGTEEDEKCKLPDELQLGETVNEKNQYGPKVIPEIAQKVLKVLKQGLEKEERENIIKNNFLPENCKNLQAPILNPEIKAILTQKQIAGDRKMSARQSNVAVALAAILICMDNLIKEGDNNNIGPLIDAITILSDIQYSDNKASRSDNMSKRMREEDKIDLKSIKLLEKKRGYQSGFETEESAIKEEVKDEQFKLPDELKLGETVNEKNLYAPKFIPEIAQKVLKVLKQGLEKEERENIIKNNFLPENCKNLQAPILNPEIKAILTQKQIAGDKKMSARQSKVAVALAAILKCTDNLIKEGYYNNVVPLIDALKILSDIQYFGNKARRSVIMSSLDKKLVNILDETDVDGFLFEKELSKKILLLPYLTLPSTWPIVQPSGLEWSRYHKEFEELSFIAEGGFGSVFKARHRLDGVEYAVKKIYIKSSDVNSIMRHLSEVKIIASLNHSNIVNYKAAWLEPMIESTVKQKRKYPMDTDSDEFSAFKYDVSSTTSTNFIASFKTHKSKELTKNNSQSDFVISFRNSNSLKNLESLSGELEESDSEEESKSKTQEENAVCKLLGNNDKEYEKCSRVNLKWATLYIQMTYCQQTLKQWLDERNNHMSLSRKNSDDAQLNSSDINVLIDMFTQLVRGLLYIHSRGIIHHDIKPSNVFVAQSENGLLVQLGDFGLSCLPQHSHRGRGTPLYAAPEQLGGQCNPMSDMYSLGIILLEMVEAFSTDMEFVKTITDLRKGQIPAHLTANYPKIAHIIEKLVQDQPSRRLDTNQLLEELTKLSENKDNTIRNLKEKLAAKDDEIAHLKMSLAKLSNKL